MAKKSFLGAIHDKTALKEKGGIGALMVSTEHKAEVKHKQVIATPNKEVNKELRQSFIIMSQDLDKLKDYVYLKKTQGDFSFSQKEALHLALQLLFDQEKSIPTRPAKVKQQEANRSMNLSRMRAIK